MANEPRRANFILRFIAALILACAMPGPVVLTTGFVLGNPDDSARQRPPGSLRPRAALAPEQPRKAASDWTASDYGTLLTIYAGGAAVIFMMILVAAAIGWIIALLPTCLLGALLSFLAVRRKIFRSVWVWAFTGAGGGAAMAHPFQADGTLELLPFVLAGLSCSLMFHLCMRRAWAPPLSQPSVAKR